MTNDMMYQISTLNALALGYTRRVSTVAELLEHGNIGLGTFENADGEMIVLDGSCYRATDDGSVTKVPNECGVTFASVAFMEGDTDMFDLHDIDCIESLKNQLDLKIEEGFGLNSMHVVRVDASFRIVKARAEKGVPTQHVELKEILKERQREFEFERIMGTLVCLYHPDYMQGMNAAGWHFHFLSSDTKFGGHVFDLAFLHGRCMHKRLNQMQVKLPSEPVFDTYSLTSLDKGDIKQVEQGKG